jgi:hypothetical protein
MPRGPAPQWKRRIEPVLDAHVLASVNAGPMNPENGHYAVLVYTGCQSMDRAQRIKRNLFNSAKILGYSMGAKIESLPDGSYQVRFNAREKKYARAAVIAKYGPDRSKWPYDPRKKAGK